MASTEPAHRGALETALARAMHEHWRLFLGEGVILSLLGLAAIIVPVAAGLVATIFLGWLFVVAGAVGIIATLRASNAPGFGWALLSAIAALAAGLVLLWNPFQGLATLTYVLTAFFVVDGLLIIALAIAHRRELSAKWQWMMVNGIIDLVLAAIIVSGFPATLYWALGLIVGVDLLFGGASLVAMALDARKAAPG